ncbi:ATP-dependent helicase, partial [Candidatus Woesearchaeota archaeon CG11_big_fil_rev_8_21_14_0_20_57_5]
LRKVLAVAIDRSETLLRRFRHCAGRSLMILRNYRGRTKRVGRQQVSSRILLNAVKRISQDFPILAEARREVLEDLMDVERAQLILDSISDGTMQVKELSVPLPSPFSLNLVTQGVADTLKIEDRAAFLQRMHQQILAQIALKERSVQKARDDADSS